MSGFSDLSKQMGTLEELERQLNLKQLQINRLLTITQAINSNVSASGLFEMYTSFLSWEMGVDRMALFFKEEDSWECTASSGLEEIPAIELIREELESFTRLANLDGTDHSFFGQFDVVVPVRHKDTALAYAFIGGFSEDEDMYNKVQFITTITNIVAVAIENKRLFKRQLEQKTFKRELELASQMQRMLIPAQLPKNPFYELSSIYLPHQSVGGDYFDFIELDDKTIAFCIGDISGKGMAAALLMANFQAQFHRLAHLQVGIKKFVRALNQSVLEITGGKKFITFFVAEYKLEEGKLIYVNAGHNPPVLAMGNRVERLEKGCTILGMFDELPQVEIGEIDITEDALILTYTDGLTDIKNDDGEFLDEDAGKNFVRDNHHLSAEAFNKKLWESVERYRGSQEYPDDFTVLTCKIHPPTP
ncbi:MAG: PP2C family protein-serine/threonine phosphatase [Bacteroidetes bacterium]|nr:PP2C family protein-serine/threonine phosphatase [Bacteroidota bacterium]